MSIMRSGSRGPEVVELQRRLVTWGYPLLVDGVYGPMTMRAVIALQLAEGLSADGIAGPLTLAHLDAGPAAYVAERASALGTADTPQLRALFAARCDLGAMESPAGANTGPALVHLVDGYGAHHRVPSLSPPPWCAIAVCSWTAYALGLGDVGAGVDWRRHPFGDWLGSVAAIYEWADVHDCLIDAEPGAIYVMARDGSGSDSGPIEAGHCGLIESIGPMLTTIDGNVSNGVRRMRRPAEQVRGYVRWWP